MEMSADALGDLLRQLLGRGVGYWGNWASILALIGVIYNYARLAKVHRIVECEHDKVLEAMKPFDLYDAVRRLRKLLESDRSTKKKAVFLKSLDEFSEHLRSYFRQIHGLKGDTDNMYLEMGDRLLRRSRVEEAREYFGKALGVAREKGDEEEEFECVDGMRKCQALHLSIKEFHEFDRERERMDPPLDLSPRQRLALARKMTGIWVQFFFEMTFSKRGRRRRRYRGFRDDDGAGKGDGAGIRIVSRADLSQDSDDSHDAPS